MFDGDNYHIWAAIMETHLEANDLWKTVEEDYEVFPLPANPTMAQIKNQKERKARKSKASGIIIPMYIVIKIIGAIQNSIQHYQDSDYDEDDENDIQHNVNSRHF